MLEIDEEFGLFNNCSSVLDLGCAPGSWLQVAKRKTKSKGPIIGVDILRFQLSQGVPQIEGDLLDKSARKRILTVFNGRKIDLILSDMSPNLSGIKVVDGENVSKLVNHVLDFSLENLHKNGCVVVKAFETGVGSREFRAKLAKYFEKVWLRKPLASKKVSAEQFLCKNTKIIVYLKTYLEYSYPIKHTNKFGV